MLTTQDVTAQAALLLHQRLSFHQNRYIGLTQLVEHDYRLLDCIALLHSAQHSADDTDSGWLQWLLSADETSLLNLSQLQHFNQPALCWLLLHELKCHRQPQLLARFVGQYLQLTDKVETDLAWQLAARQGLTLNQIYSGQLTDGQLSAGAITWLGYSGQQQYLQVLLKLIKRLSPDDARLNIAQCSAFLLGHHSEQSHLINGLLDTEQLTEPRLMLLMLTSDDSQQARIITALANRNNATHWAIRAMAYSGQLKFVPLLVELSQQQDTKEPAADALAILLGALQADTLLCEPHLGAFEAGKMQRQLAALPVTTENLSRVLRQGNQCQRQLAACHQFMFTAGQPLMFTDVLLGAPACAN